MGQTIRTFLRWCQGVALALGVAGCSVAPLADTHDSAPDVARAVLQSLQRGDRAALLGLALSEAEFRDHVWPELPASRPERNLPLDYVWGDLYQKSQSSLAVTLANHGGRPYELVSVRFEGPTTRYLSYDVHREAVVQVRLPDGTQTEEKLFGSLIEKQGRWKVFSYVVDN